MVVNKVINTTKYKKGGMDMLYFYQKNKFQD